MVGLIPRDRILHVLGKSKSPSITQNSELMQLCEKDRIELVETHETGELRQEIRKYRPEILVIEEEFFQNNLEETYRSKSCIPFKIVRASAKQDKEKIFDYFKAGADEVITDDISAEELYLKFFSILRRKKVLELNQLTNLPSINKTYGVVEHSLRNLSDWLVIHIDILRFQSYKVIYGVSKADNSVRVAARILRESLQELKLKEFFVGHLGRDNFVIVADTNSLDSIIKTINANFHNALKDLYIESDFENGYIICPAPHRVRRREGLLEFNIGYSTNIDRSFLSGSDVIEQSIKNKKDSGSKNKRVLVLESDPDFALLLEDTLLREGYDAKTSAGVDSLLKEVADFKPKIIILEASTVGQANFVPLCKSLEKYREEFGTRIIVATNIPGYQNFLAVGADIYIPKPYDLEILLKEVRRLKTNY